jgi:type VI secretion system secreted protein VgrG
MQAWAGTGWGFQFIPRIGMEVVVSFLGGDLDRPVVMGCLYNAVSPPSHPLPASSTRSGVRSHSSPGGGGWNEIAFEDRAGQEQLYLKAQRNQDEEVGLDRTEKVGRDASAAIGRDMRTEVGQHRVDATGGDHRVIINGVRTVSVAHHDDLDVRGARVVKVSGTDIKRVEGASTVEIGRAHDESVGGDSSLTVLGNHVVVVEGEERRDVRGAGRITYSKGCSLNVAGGVVLAVGTKDAPATAEAKLGGDLVLRGDGAIEIVSERRIQFRVGKTLLTLDSKEMRLEAERITLSAKSIEAAGEKGSLSVGEKVEVKADAVKLTSKDDAIIELNEEAKIDGKVVKIKPGLAAEMAKRAEREEQAEKADKVDVRLFDLAGEPIPNAPYEVSFFGYYDEGTAADGTVKIPVFPDVETAHLRWGRPKDKRENPQDKELYEYEMEVYLMVDAKDDNETLRRKLHNLGHGGCDLTAAVRHYQDSLGTERTGSVNDVLADVSQRHDAVNPVKIKPE